jgi:hypothetical protein
LIGGHYGPCSGISSAIQRVDVACGPTRLRTRVDFREVRRGRRVIIRIERIERRRERESRPGPGFAVRIELRCLWSMTRLAAGIGARAGTRILSVELRKVPRSRHRASGKTKHREDREKCEWRRSQHLLPMTARFCCGGKFHLLPLRLMNRSNYLALARDRGLVSTATS